MVKSPNEPIMILPKFDQADAHQRRNPWIKTSSPLIGHPLRKSSSLIGPISPIFLLAPILLREQQFNFAVHLLHRIGKLAPSKRGAKNVMPLNDGLPGTPKNSHVQALPQFPDNLQNINA